MSVLNCLKSQETKALSSSYFGGAMADKLSLYHKSRLIFQNVVPSGRQNYIVKARLMGNQSKCPRCLCSIAITLCSQHLLKLKLKKKNWSLAFLKQDYAAFHLTILSGLESCFKYIFCPHVVYARPSTFLLNLISVIEFSC